MKRALYTLATIGLGISGCGPKAATVQVPPTATPVARADVTGQLSEAARVASLLNGHTYLAGSQLITLPNDLRTDEENETPTDASVRMGIRFDASGGIFQADCHVGSDPQNAYNFHFEGSVQLDAEHSTLVITELQKIDGSAPTVIDLAQPETLCGYLLGSGANGEAVPAPAPIHFQLLNDGSTIELRPVGAPDSVKSFFLDRNDTAATDPAAASPAALRSAE